MKLQDKMNGKSESASKVRIKKFLRSIIIPRIEEEFFIFLMSCHENHTRDLNMNINMYIFRYKKIKSI